MKAQPSRLRASLRASTIDAACDAAKIGFGEIYFPAFALLLGATPFQVGVVATVPILAGSVFQLFAPAAAHLIGERRWVIACATAQALLFIPTTLLACFSANGYPALLALVCAYWMLNLGVSPGWNAWMGRMIPAAIRSRYFGRRNVGVHSSLFLSLLGGGFLIDAAQRSGVGAWVGFAATFTLAGIARLISVWFLLRQHDPGAHGPPVTRVPATAALERFSSQPYGRLIFLIVLINGAVNISAAYFTPFMLEKLELSYARFTILSGTIVVARVLSSRYWGEIARAYGNRRALQVATTLIIPLSSLWLISDNYAYLIGLQLLGGFAWAGFELTTFLNLFDCTTDRNRATVLSIYNLLNGLTIVTGSLGGGLLLRSLGDTGYATLFVLSSSCRLLIALTMARGVGVRRRAGEHAFSNVFMRVVTLRPGEGDDLDPMIIDEQRPEPDVPPRPRQTRSH